ncbi:hypothetical protein T03_656 [Trichinella britovi]|uniref:Uncharacterized protein n=1 Tax=Trichinella britovi TaxID=45882 RepID=A0A0V1AIB8_TRIBR|nr:hypothetical protein T03_656 [Trichinella britovi]
MQLSAKSFILSTFQPKSFALSNFRPKSQNRSF